MGTEDTSIVDSALEYLRRPLEELVEERSMPQYRHSMDTKGMVNKDGVGFVANPWGDVQVGGDGANMICYPQHAFISLKTNEVFVPANLRLFPSSAGRAFEINSGQINPLLVPPISTPLSIPPGTTFAPPYAVLAVKSLSSRVPSNTVIVDISTDTPTGSPGREGIPAVPYVNVPPHQHIVQVNPTTGTGRTVGVTDWVSEPGPSCSVPLHGVSYQYMFGYNRMHEIAADSAAEIGEI